MINTIAFLVLLLACIMSFRTNHKLKQTNDDLLDAISELQNGVKHDDE
jgi:hypothetical protein